MDVEYIRRVDRPQNRYDLDELVEKMRAFHGRCTIQTMFLKGTWQGESVDNTTERYVLPWLQTIKTINPMLVTIYTIDRDTPDESLEKATHEELDAIAERIRNAGLKCSVSY